MSIRMTGTAGPRRGGTGLDPIAGLPPTTSYGRRRPSNIPLSPLRTTGGLLTIITRMGGLSPSPEIVGRNLSSTAVPPSGSDVDLQRPSTPPLVAPAR